MGSLLVHFCPVYDMSDYPWWSLQGGGRDWRTSCNTKTFQGHPVCCFKGPCPEGWQPETSWLQCGFFFSPCWIGQGAKIFHLCQTTILVEFSQVGHQVLQNSSGQGERWDFCPWASKCWAEALNQSPRLPGLGMKAGGSCPTQAWMGMFPWALFTGNGWALLWP